MKDVLDSIELQILRRADYMRERATSLESHMFTAMKHSQYE